VAELANVNADDAVIIPELKAALEEQTARSILAAAGDDAAADREVTIMGDREIPYSLLKKIMATCTAADYGRLSLAVVQKGENAAGAGLASAG
jgi:biopolymer transport protein ExbD